MMLMEMPREKEESSIFTVSLASKVHSYEIGDMKLKIGSVEIVLSSYGPRWVMNGQESFHL
jgi:hypothetical protein